MIISIGKDRNGNILNHDLSKLPIILMAGATGSGKSNLAHFIICSLIKENKPEDLKLLLFDCKRVEFRFFYKNIPNLVVPVGVCDRNDLNIFKRIIDEINNRKQKLVQKPFIFIVIDEFSDLAWLFPIQLENFVENIAKYGSDVGIGLIMYTSRPGKDIITKKIDQLVETRIGLETASDVDSNVIIHQLGCTKLLGKGDGLYLRYINSKPIHFQAPLITDEEIEKTISKIMSKK